MEKAATSVMPLPTSVRQSNSRDGNSRASAIARRSRRRRPARRGRAQAGSTSGRARSTRRRWRSASPRRPGRRAAASGKGGGGLARGGRRVAALPVSTRKLAAAMAKPAIENRPNAQRQDSASATSAPNSGPAKAATPQIADMTANSCGQMARSNSRSTDTKASETRRRRPALRPGGRAGTSASTVRPRRSGRRRRRRARRPSCWSAAGRSSPAGRRRHRPRSRRARRRRATSRPARRRRGRRPSPA